MNVNGGAAPYRTSSFCGVTNCVEVAGLPDGNIAVRDSKDRTSVQQFTRIEWDQFLLGVKAGEFDTSILIPLESEGACQTD